MKFFCFLIIFCVHANGQHATKTVEEDTRFYEYRKCLSSTKSLLFGKASNEYENMNRQHNRAIPKVNPIAIFTPKSSIDVQTAVKCGVIFDMNLVPISGGHSYAGLSYGTNDSILIDFRHMNRIAVDLSETFVYVEPGTMIGYLNYHLMKSGLMVSVGSCMTVAMGGYILGGGAGQLSNHFGLAIDNLLEMKMVDASGNEVLIDENHNADLWWAMRGIGPGYIGLLTSIKMKVHKIKDLNLVHLKIRFHNDDFKNFMENYIKWLNWLERNDENISSVVTVHHEKKIEPRSMEIDARGIVLNIVKVQGPHMRYTESNLNFIEHALELFVGKSEYHSFQFDRPEYVDFLARILYGPMEMYCERKDIDGNLAYFRDLKREDAGDPKYEKRRSFFVKKSATANLTAKSFEKAHKILSHMTVGSSIIIDSEQGQIAKISPDASAYVHRDSQLNLLMHTASENESQFYLGREWLEKFYESVEFLDSKETFQNYPDRCENDFAQRYYGTNLKRLIEIKKKWDPNYYFQSEMSLPIDIVSALQIKKETEKCLF